MFTTILLSFLIAGTFMCYFDIMLPGVLVPVVAIGFRFIGLMLMWVGPILYLVRSYNTGGAAFTQLADPRYTNVIVQGESNGRIVRMKKDLLNTLRYKEKRYRDMGEALRISGHDVQIASETQFPTFPKWLMDYIDQIHNKFGVESHAQLEQLATELKNIKSTFDIENIELLKPFLSDTKKREDIKNIPLEDLKQLRFKLYDGRTITYKPYMDWFENSNAYDVESIIGKTIAHREKQNASYKYGVGMDIAKYAIPIFIILIGVGVAFKFMQGG